MTSLHAATGAVTLPHTTRAVKHPDMHSDSPKPRPPQHMPPTPSQVLSPPLPSLVPHSHACTHMNKHTWVHLHICIHE